MIIEGKNAVIEALRARMPLSRILIAEGGKADKALDEIRRLAASARVESVLAPRRELDRMSERGVHQGVIAQAEPFRFTALHDVLESIEHAPRALVIVLDHITDPGNLGAVVRSAEVVGAAAVIVPKKRSAALTPAAWKSSAGAFAHVPVVQETNLVRTIEQLKERRFWIAGASENAKDSIWDVDLDGRIALVMGSEGDGLSRLVEESCDFLVRLPQAGRVGSLNVAQATTAIAYEWVRRGHEAEVRS